jgi:hypothetical protein
MAPWHALTGFRAVGLLNVMTATPARPSVAKASHSAPLNRLATNPGEKCGLRKRPLPLLAAEDAEIKIFASSKRTGIRLES